MDWNFLFVNILNGVVYGSFLLLTSLGLSLVFGLGRVAGMQSLQSASATLMLYSAITKAGSTDPEAVIRALETIEVNTPVGSLKFQPSGRQALVPLFLGPYEKLDSPRYGATYGQRVEPFPASKSLPKSAAEYGCKLG